MASNIIVTFSEPIQRGSGSIVLKTAAGSVVETYSAATSPALSITGNSLALNPSADLASGTRYFVEFSAGSFKDLVGNDYAGTTSYDFTTAAALPPLSKLDNFVAAQFASPAILGSGPGHDTYVLAPSLLPAGTSMTISDTEGNNAVQLADGLAIASSRVAANALQLTLLNGSVITLLGAAHFGFDAGGNASAGIDGPDLAYADFAQQVLGVTVPGGSGLNTGGALVIGGGSALPAFPAGTKNDQFVVAQYASPAILGSGPGNDTYLLSPSMLPPGTQMTISDVDGSNSVQLAHGLAIASSRVAANALQLTLDNGSVITILGAASFGYEAGGNRSAGTDGPDRSYTDFALQVLGVAMPASGFAVGGPVLIGAPVPGGAITVPAGSSLPLAGTSGADVFQFDVSAARAAVANTQIDISRFATADDLLRLELPLTSGPEADGNIIAITLLGVTDPSQMQIEVV